MAEEIMEVTEGIDTGADAASAGTEAASPTGDDFMAGFWGEGETGEEGEPQASDGEGEPKPKETAEPVAEGDRAESRTAEETKPETVTFTEHGKNYTLDKTVLDGFAGAVGRKPEEVIALYQKGCGFDTLQNKWEEAKGDSDLIADLAKYLGQTVEEARADLRSRIDRYPVDAAKSTILKRNPNLADEEAERWAIAEVEAQKARDASSAEAKAKTEAERKAADEEAERAGKIREIEAFENAHPEVKDQPIPAEVVEAFQNGEALETAWNRYQQNERIKALEEENQKLKTEKEKAERDGYNRQHAAGSAATNAGAAEQDPFLAGLFGT